MAGPKGFVLSPPFAWSEVRGDADTGCGCSSVNGDLYLRRNTCVLNELGGNGWGRQLHGRVCA